jgi:SAM-dependent methyltransferase
MMNAPKVLWHKAMSFWFEAYLGIETIGAVAPITDEGVHYTPLPYPLISRMLTSLHLSGSDVFVDVGCGKGRVVCCASRIKMRRVVALEINKDLLALAVANARRVRGKRTPVDPVAASADVYNFEDATVVYLYNPFNARITNLVIQQLFLSYSRRPRGIRIVYANPVHEQVLDRQGWLEKYDEWPATDFPVFGRNVTFWRSREV